MLPQKTYGFIWHHVKQQPVGFALLTIAHLAWSIDQTLLPYAFKLFIDKLSLFEGDPTNIWPAITMPILFGAAIWIITEIGYRGYDFLTARIMPKFEASIRLSMFGYVQRHAYDFFSSNLVGTTANKINDMTGGSRRMLEKVTIFFLPSLLAFTIAISIFFHMHPLFALVTFIWVSLHISICFFTAPKCQSLSLEHAESRSRLNGRMIDSLANYLGATLFARREEEFDRITKSQAIEQEKHSDTLRYIFKIRLAQTFLTFTFNGVLTTWLMIYQWQQGFITLGDVVYIFYTSWNIAVMTWLSGMELPNYFKEFGICKQAMSIIKQPHAITEAVGAKPLQVKKGQIEFDHVTFNYHGHEDLFQKKNTMIKAGSKVGLVGYSGSGKTTFVHLILRLYDLVEGKITIDGQDISEVSLDSLRDHIAMIPQDPVLFHRSLFENIAYGKPDATKEEVIAIAKKAHCHEFISKLKDGYDTVVGERGIKLSGGQRQLISIARAMLKDAPILILDEATSSLDSVTEKHIQDTIHQVIAGRTTIVIAHRLSTISDLERILVFDDGHIVEDGSHETLLKKKGHYAKMWEKQVGGFLPNYKAKS